MSFFIYQQTKTKSLNQFLKPLQIFIKVSWGGVLLFDWRWHSLPRQDVSVRLEMNRPSRSTSLICGVITGGTVPDEPTIHLSLVSGRVLDLPRVSSISIRSLSPKGSGREVCPRGRIFICPGLFSKRRWQGCPIGSSTTVVVSVRVRVRTD